MPSKTIREAADALGVSVPTIRNWIASGRLEARKMPGNHGLEYRIDDAEITRLQTSQPDKTIVIHEEQADPVLSVPSSWLLGQLSGTIREMVRDVIRDEVESMKVDVADELRRELAAADDRATQRDQQVMELLREIRETRRKEIGETTSWWTRWFRGRGR